MAVKCSQYTVKKYRHKITYILFYMYLFVMCDMYIFNIYIHRSVYNSLFKTLGARYVSEIKNFQLLVLHTFYNTLQRRVLIFIKRVINQRL